MPDRIHSAGHGRSGPEQAVYGRPPPRGSRSLLVLLPVLAFFAGFGAIVWLAYVDSSAISTSGEPPLIRADDRPIKVPPDDPGGRVVADQGELRDLFSEEPEPVTERLLPLPEEPLSPPSAEVLAQRADELTRETTASAGSDEPAGTAVPPAAAATAETAAAAPEAPAEEEEGVGGPPATAAAIEALLEETGAGRAESEAATAAARPADQVPSAPAPAGAAAATAAAERAAERRAAAPSQAAAPAPEPEPEPESEQQTLLARAPSPAAASPRPAGSLDEPHYRIQLAAVRNEADARRAWELFKLDLSELVAGVEPIIERGETGNGVFYRVQLGPYADAGQAEDLCQEFKQRNASCFVLRR